MSGLKTEEEDIVPCKQSSEQPLSHVPAIERLMVIRVRRSVPGHGHGPVSSECGSQGGRDELKLDLGSRFQVPWRAVGFCMYIVGLVLRES